MTVEKMFEKASREKLRFNYKGMLSVEDLWDLSVEGLDEIFRDLNSVMKKSQEESLLKKKTVEDSKTELKVEIIKHIVGIKLAEADDRLKAKENKEKKQALLKLLDEKENEELRKMSAEEIKSKLQELD